MLLASSLMLSLSISIKLNLCDKETFSTDLARLTILVNFVLNT